MHRHALIPIVALLWVLGCEQISGSSGLELRVAHPEKEECEAPCRSALLPSQGGEEVWIAEKADFRIRPSDVELVSALSCASDHPCWKAVLVISESGRHRLRSLMTPPMISRWVEISYQEAQVGVWPASALTTQIVIGPFSDRGLVRHIAKTLGVRLEGKQALIGEGTDAYGDVDLDRIDRLLEEANEAIGDSPDFSEQ